MKSFFSIITLVAAALTTPVAAQQTLVPTQEIINTGEVMFQTPRSVKFELVNKGDKAVRITAVHPSCGCTTAEWPKDEIAAGETATITAVYDARMLGTFQKELEVYTTASEEPLYLTLQGRVVSQLTDYEGDFPIDLGVVRLNTNQVEFDDVNRGDYPMAHIEIVNTTKQSYTPQLMHLPPYLNVKYAPERLAGGRVGRILLTLDSEKLPAMGLNQTSIYLARYMGDKVSETNEIDVSAVLLPNFSQLTPDQAAHPPVMQLSADSLDFRHMADKKKMTQVITITNTGERPLTIDRLQVYGKALSVSLSSRQIAPGKSAKLKVTVSAQYLKKSKTRPRVLIITNDPKNAKTVIPVKV